MAGFLSRRTLTWMILRKQPCRYKNWCSKDKEAKDCSVKHAAQESLYKNYDVNRCQKTVFCQEAQNDCKQEEEQPLLPPCPPEKKSSVTDALGKMIWFCIKSGIVVAMVYVTIDAGVWKGPDETYELAEVMYKRILEILGLDDTRKP